ncbi:predicted protein [Micromonas commoda]|uniref:Gamma-tubulin complex component n=1 Tax=Micromonas commoda (strain RCC299 / NOUM17 / CCMP2709) TaxID=296587 RepID=C1EE97_MICCC|nr:predicted protein [Micromonas commoda]ACO66498.1 predicted protein [Micromonas commoda]|eukprot:XP_002505240.1 predicted protein [Micromonas commoda]
MVPEVLLALLGVPGEVITLVPATSDGGQERFRVSPDLPFLEPPERASLDRLVSLGYAFRCLERFVAREDEAGTTMATLPSGPDASFAFNAPASGGSLYRRALAAGVSEVLATYESAILRLEQDILRGVTPALPAALESALSGFALVLPALHVTLRPVIERPDLKGAPLLHHLHAAALAAGAPQLEAALRSLRARCYRAMYQQLLAWTVHGVLVDPHGEFWVRPVEGAGGDGGVYLGDFDESGAAKATGALGGNAPGDDGGEREWHRGFQVSLEALPPGVELPAAEAVLFAGRAVRVLTRPRGEFAGGSLLPDAVASRATEALRGLARVEGEGNDGEFDRLAFESTVEGIRAPVAARLGELVVRDAKLAKHLEALRSYHLLGRGDFFQSFFEEAASLLAVPPRANTAEADVAAPFAAAASKSSASDDPLLPRFRLRFVSPNQGVDDTGAGAGGSNVQKRGPNVRVPSYDGWDGLELEYATPWPLGLLLTRSVQRRYNHLFQYLFRLRRAALALDDAWFALRRKSASGTLRWTTTPGSFTSGHGVKGFGGDGAFQLCQRVRHDMAFVVNNWFTYLQVDVVEAQYRAMIERVEASEGDFSECQRAHRAFLAALTAQSFLDLPSVSDVIETIMRLAGNLLAVVKSLPSDGLGEGVGEETADEIEAIGAEFSRQSAALYTVLRSNRLANDPKAPFLRTLLLRLNFNGYFFDNAAKTSSGHDAGGSDAPSVRSSASSMKSFRSGWGEAIPPMPSLSLKRGI